MSNHDLDFLKVKIDELKEAGVYRELPINYGPCDNRINLNGKEVVNLSSNNYLGLANHPRVKKAAIDAVNKYGRLYALHRIVSSADTSPLKIRLKEKKWFI